MLQRSSIGVVTLVVSLVLAVGSARAFDDAKYPDLRGQWGRAVAPGASDEPRFDPAKPPGREADQWRGLGEPEVPPAPTAGPLLAFRGGARYTVPSIRRIPQAYPCAEVWWSGTLAGCAAVPLSTPVRPPFRFSYDIFRGGFIS